MKYNNGCAVCGRTEDVDYCMGDYWVCDCCNDEVEQEYREIVWKYEQQARNEAVEVMAAQYRMKFGD